MKAFSNIGSTSRWFSPQLKYIDVTLPLKFHAYYLELILSKCSHDTNQFWCICSVDREIELSFYEKVCITALQKLFYVTFDYCLVFDALKQTSKALLSFIISCRAWDQLSLYKLNQICGVGGKNFLAPNRKFIITLYTST